MHYNIARRSAFLLLLLLPLVFIWSCKKEQADPPKEQMPADTTLPKITVVSAKSPSEGNILVSPSNTAFGHIMILDKSGQVLRSKKTEGQVLCFRQWNINGSKRYTYLVKDPAGYQIPVVGTIGCYAVIADENLNELKRIHLLPYNGRTDSSANVVDGHDFILLSDEHYICVAYFEKAVNNIDPALKPVKDARVVAPIIQEVENGQVIWEWDGTSHPELYSASVEGNTYGKEGVVNDYAHLNSIFIDPRDNNLICSFRNLNQILKIDRKTGGIIWRLGGRTTSFKLTADQQFLRQHDVTLADDNKTLLVFDNGHAIDRPHTRILEFQLDEAGKTVTSFKTTPIPVKIFSQFMGSVQKRGSTYFIGGGSGNYVMEMDHTTGEILLDVRFSEASYRAYKVD